MRDYHTLSPEQQVPNVISTPAATSNINEQTLPPQINHLDIPQISLNRQSNGVSSAGT
ncbi:hypothetical protein RhiirA5_442854 [Rhizophagus irregularis]|uniref:Uncharacterized protein n=1 Tax=Rhizophagus irregularis TaxID=588596 RepID=A0A2N0NED4_9GLOM|nr:hypothetical protein RhiirA5_442854 [Rhizophagus irregularis]PKC68319.1 hypothetical protein RhiirA1_457349 [Rhizophagus irregularis]